jgi:hypothetical protein
MKDFTMVIPSYWERAGNELISEEKIVFDHPTPLNEQGTLPRLLDSLDILQGMEGRVVVIAVANDPAIVADVEEKVNGLSAPYRDRYDVCCFGQTQIDILQKRLAVKGVSQSALALMNLDNYAAVRNMCSLAGILDASPYTVFIDDDEVFTDPEFLFKIEEDVAGEINGKSVEALAGYYLQPDTYLLEEGKVRPWQKPHWNNADAMNRAFKLFIGEGPRLKPTPFVFGGNMTVSLSVLKKVPFDPRITRGEDIDFLLNMRTVGITMYLDRQLAIKHLPPPSSSPAWKKIREDAVRFLYERKKVSDHPELCIEEFMPYPGEFLGEDLEERIVRTCERLIRDYDSEGDGEGARECRATIQTVKENPFGSFDTRALLKELAQNWQELTASAEGVGIPG